MSDDATEPQAKDPKPDDPSRQGELERTITMPQLAIYGCGTILGAGIYVVIGKIAGEAGFWMPLSFLLAAAVALFTALSYSELTSRMPKAGGPAAYVDDAFGLQWLSVTVGWAIVVTGVVSAATITSGFSGYLGVFVDWPGWIATLALPLVLGAVAAWGVEESTKFMLATTAAGVLGLLFVLYVGFAHLDQLGERMSQMPSLGESGTWAGLLTGTFLAFYAFIGFEDMVHMAEETKNPVKTMPRAILLAIVVSTVLYFVVGASSLLVLDPQALSDSKAPLVDVVEQAGYPGWPLAFLSLWIIVNGALAQIIMSSRVIYGLERRGGAPKWLAKVDEKTSTPLLATAGVTLVVLTLALLVPLKQLAQITSFVMLGVFLASNIALIRIEAREPDAEFDTPVPLPYIAAALCVALMVVQIVAPTSH